MKVFLIAAISIDGFIARDSDQISTAWTSKEDKHFFSERTKQAGVIVMGRKTFETIGRPLPGRMNIVVSRQLSETSEKVQGARFKVQEFDSSQLQAQNSKLDNTIFVTSLSASELIQELEKANFQEVAICGGQQVYTMFLEAGLIDTLYITIEPVVFGSGIKLVDSKQVIGNRWLLKEIKKLNETGTVLLEYEIIES